MAHEKPMSNAIQAALARVQKHAAAAALLTPLALVAGASPAQAVVAAATLPGVSIGTATSTTAGVTTFTYTVTNSSFQNQLDSFEIPEFHVGDLTAKTLARGWTVTAEATSSQVGTGFKSGPLPGAYLLVSTTPGSGITAESPGTFTFTSTLPGTASANFGGSLYAYNIAAEGYQVSQTGYVDPLVPAAAPTVPEPASMLILGGAVLAAGAVRTRRRG